jgi:predicted permease
MTMLLIGMMLAEVDWRSMVDFNTLFISAMRLAVIPAIVLAGCRLAHVDQFLTSVCVLMTSMPAGSTAAILAAKYNCDYAFGTKCVVVSTLLSMISIPIWAMIL